MTYRLKDKELQKKLDDISRGEFSQKLNEGAKLNGILGVFEVRFNICGVYVEERREYNPKSWNDFPAVTPPYDVLMRCEEDTENGTEHLCMKFVRDQDGGHWTDENGMGVWSCTRFRPWED